MKEKKLNNYISNLNSINSRNESFGNLILWDIPEIKNLNISMGGIFMGEKKIGPVLNCELNNPRA